MKCVENKTGMIDGIAQISIIGNLEWAERIDAEMKQYGFDAACQDNDDDLTDITYAVKRADVAYFKKCYNEAKKATKNA